MTQDIKQIEASAALKELSKNNEGDTEIISEETYIFEPSSYDVIIHLERSMLQIMLSQVIFDSQLAQYASRFRAMTLANNRSVESLGEVRTLYNRTRRERRDTQLKMIINDLRIINAKSQKTGGS
jgi:F0F1-type ATP synthase gamma subunit